MKVALGIDIGGTKIAGGLVHESGKLLVKKVIATETQNEDILFESIINLMNALMEKSGKTIEQLEGIGLGVPGLIDQRKGLAVFQNNLPWRNFPIQQKIKDYYGINRVVMNHDVAVSAIAEWNRYSKDDYDRLPVFLYVTISTGIACTIMIDGEVFQGAGIPGELGMIPVMDLKKNTYQPLEAVSSGPAISRVAKQSKKFETPLTTAEVFEQFYKGNKKAEQIIMHAISQIALIIYGAISTLDPHVVVIGGGVANNHPIVIEKIKEIIHSYEQDQKLNRSKRIHPSIYKGNSGIIGAALTVFKT